MGPLGLLQGGFAFGGHVVTDAVVDKGIVLCVVDDLFDHVYGTVGLHCSVSFVRTVEERKSGLVSITRRGREPSV